MIFDSTGLAFNHAIIDDKDVQVLCYTHETGAPILSATLAQPSGQVFFAIDDIYHHLFITDKITLQALFEAAAPNIVTVADDCEYNLYVRNDVAILLKEGEKLYSQFEKNK
jgi:hypothetical protein